MTSLQKSTTRLLNENRVAGTLYGAGLFVAWFGWPVLCGAAKLVREAACGAAHPDERDAPARGWAPRPSIYSDGQVYPLREKFSP